jgi:hypothetical protein
MDASNLNPTKYYGASKINVTRIGRRPGPSGWSIFATAFFFLGQQ